MQKDANNIQPAMGDTGTEGGANSTWPKNNYPQGQHKPVHFLQVSTAQEY